MIPTTITTTDQNTCRPITWDVLHAHPRSGSYTHMLTLARPKGHKGYIMNVRLSETGDLLAHDRPVTLMGRVR